MGLHVKYFGQCLYNVYGFKSDHWRSRRHFHSPGSRIKKTMEGGDCLCRIKQNPEDGGSYGIALDKYTGALYGRLTFILITIRALASHPSRHEDG